MGGQPRAAGRSTATCSSPTCASSTSDRTATATVEDIEVVTPHYRGAHAAAKGRTGFTRYRVSTGSSEAADGRSRTQPQPADLRGVPRDPRGARQARRRASASRERQAALPGRQ